MAANDGEHPIGEIFPGITLPSGTGASGSPVTPDEGPEVGNPVVTGLYDSAQDTAELDRVSVQAGDTTQGDPAAQTPISPGGEGYTDTNAGRGSVMTNEHRRFSWQQPAGST